MEAELTDLIKNFPRTARYETKIHTTPILRKIQILSGSNKLRMLFFLFIINV